MALDLDKLENVVDRGDRWEARCPVCAAAGRDANNKNHLVIFRDGKKQGAFGCALECDTKEIFELVGIKTPRRAQKIQDQLTGRFRLPRFKKWAAEDWSSWKREYYVELAKEATELLPIILKDYAWSQAEALRESAALPEKPAEHWQAFLHAFQRDDVLAFHARGETGYEIFDTAENWSKRWPDSAPCKYDPTLPHERRYKDHAYGTSWARGAMRRDDTNRAVDRYTVVECDKDPRTGQTMSIKDQAAIHRYCREGLGMHLRLLTYSGGKSLHGLYTNESVEPRWTSLKIHLCGIGVGGLGVDPNAFDRSTTRTPGAIRNPDEKNDAMRLQKIVWLDPTWPAWA